jgi:hypothetical protein
MIEITTRSSTRVKAAGHRWPVGRPGESKAETCRERSGAAGIERDITSLLMAVPGPALPTTIPLRPRLRGMHGAAALRARPGTPPTSFRYRPARAGRARGAALAAITRSWGRLVGLLTPGPPVLAFSRPPPALRRRGKRNGIDDDGCNTRSQRRGRPGIAPGSLLSPPSLTCGGGAPTSGGRVYGEGRPCQRTPATASQP